LVLGDLVRPPLALEHQSYLQLPAVPALPAFLPL
jgi:hypothetical protein